jgi:hypothetical protein
MQDAVAMTIAMEARHARSAARPLEGIKQPAALDPSSDPTIANRGAAFFTLLSG